MTEQQYIYQNGGHDIIGQSIIFQASHEKTSANLRDIDKFNEKLGRFVADNYRLRMEYRRKVAIGEIHKDTIIERLIATAHGHEDNEATFAARRCCQKRGIALDL